jgi:hypothetical protein
MFSVEAAADSAGRSRQVVVPVQRRRRMRWPNTTMWLGDNPPEQFADGADDR